MKEVIIYIVTWCILTPMTIQTPFCDEFNVRVDRRDTIIFKCGLTYDKEFTDKTLAWKFIERGECRVDINILSFDSIKPMYGWYRSYAHRFLLEPKDEKWALPDYILQNLPDFDSISEYTPRTAGK